MDYNKIFNEIKNDYLTKIYNELKSLEQAKINENDLYKKYINLLDSLENTKSDLTKLNSLDMSFISNQKIKNEFKTLLTLYEVYPEDINENSINNMKNLVFEEMQKNEGTRKTYDEIIQIRSIKNKINTLPLNTIDDLYNLLEYCSKEKLISTQELIKFNFDIVKRFYEGMNIPNTKIEIEQPTEIVEISENIEDIKDKLIELYKKYGYDYESIKPREKTRLEKYANLVYTEKILSLLKQNNIKLEDYLSRQKTITNIIIFKDEEALNEINQMISENDFSLRTLLSFPSIFIKRIKKFKFKTRNGETSPHTPSNDEPSRGELESFKKNIEVYKLIKGYPKDYRITDKDLIENGTNNSTFFCTPYEKIQANIEIMKQYGLIEENNYPRVPTTYVGANTKYILDRCIELNILDYVKNNSSLVSSSDFPFKWYKIKLARDLNEEVISTKGLKVELRDDRNDYLGVTIEDREPRKQNKKIIQLPLSELQILNGRRKFPGRIINDSDIEEENLRKEFELYYKYFVVTPKDIFDDKESLIAKVLEATFNFDDGYQEIEFGNVEDDKYIQLLDKTFEQENLTYCISKLGDNGYPETEMRISRLKVLRLCSLLKEKGAWLTDEMNDEDKSNILLSVLLKNTIVSQNELNVLRNIVKNIVKKQNVELKRGWSND